MMKNIKLNLLHITYHKKELTQSVVDSTNIKKHVADLRLARP